MINPIELSDVAHKAKKSPQNNQKNLIFFLEFQKNEY